MNGSATADAAAPGTRTSLLSAWKLSKSHVTGGKVTPVIRDVSLTLEAGEIVSVVGPSGCGKTTLLNVLCGLLTPDSGEVRWRGVRLAGQPPDVGYMLQKDLLFPWRSALTNTMLGLEIRNVPRQAAEQRSRALLEQLGLHGFMDHYPSTLSGGMRQRVALARTLVNDPAILLLDEPFAALDFQTKLLIESDTAKLVRNSGRSVLLITHDIEEAVSLADRLIVLSARPTRVKATYDITLGEDRTDMIAAREHPHFADYVRRVWSDLEVARS